jgi:energy-coupling factor transporter transmembrane protein EcfT
MTDSRPLGIALMAFIIVASLAHGPIALGTLIAVAVALALPNTRRKNAFKTLLALTPGFLGMAAFIAFLEGLSPALDAFLRLISLSLGPSVFFLYCGKRDLELLLLNLRLPQAFVFAVSSALSFIPLIAEEIRAVYDALRSRGVPVDRPLGFVRFLPAMLAPILLACFRVADELGDTLVSRGLSMRAYPDRRWKSLIRDK